jgi:hypothetical protein
MAFVAGQYVSIPSLTVLEKSGREKRERLAERRNDPIFREHLKIIRMKISSGTTLSELREYLGLSSIDHDQLWDDLMYITGEVFMNPMNIIIEWSVRQQTRYQMAVDLYNMSKEAGNIDATNRAILTMAKLDENALELQKALGLIKPIQFEDGSQGIGDSDIEDAQRRFEAIAEAAITNTLVTSRQTQNSESVKLFSELDSGRAPDQLESTPLAENSAHRPK